MKLWTIVKMDDYVQFKCIKEKSRLRIKIISPGYNHEANCQFPRNIRTNGGLYKAPKSSVSFGKGPRGKFFYRVHRNSIQIIDKKELEKDVKIKINKIYEDKKDRDCLVCFENPHTIIFVPCGHYCICNECNINLKKNNYICPMCRSHIELAVTEDQIDI